MNKLYLIVLSILFLSACGSTSLSLSKSSGPNKSISKEAFQYTPQGNEQFVFGEVSDILQKYAYKDVCFSMPTRSVSIECMDDKLRYSEYVGKKGYYTGSAPYKDSNGYIAREAILETGEVIYIITSSKYKHVGDKIISLKEHEKQSNFSPQPIYKGSSVMLTGYSKVSRGNLNVSSQNNHSFTEAEIAAIRHIAALYPTNGARIANLLTTLKVDYDDFEGRTIIAGLPYNNRSSYLSVRIIIKDSGEAYPFMRTYYEADDWLFIKNFSISADGFRWDSARDLDFKRDNAGGKIWEWNSTVLTLDHINMLNKMSSANAAKMRFHGRQYYADYELTEIQKDEIGRLAELAKLISIGK